uniref:Uncharacterized protein n=1 Tax=Astyanax mexicanus TaxID=7994 RepID=A0A3B1JMF7_ASTMX
LMNGKIGEIVKFTWMAAGKERVRAGKPHFKTIRSYRLFHYHKNRYRKDPPQNSITSHKVPSHQMHGNYRVAFKMRFG